MLPLTGGYVYGRVGLFVCLIVCVFVCTQDYLQSNEQIRINLLPEVWLWTRNNPLNFGGDPDYDPHRAAEVFILGKINIHKIRLFDYLSICHLVLVLCWSIVYDAGPKSNQHWYGFQ